MKQLRDIRGDRYVKVEKRDAHYRGYTLNLVTDEFTLASTDSKMMREYITHDDTVAVLPVREESGGSEIPLIRQYRHPTRSVLWEIPAGLIDKPGEELMQAVQRELVEEIGMTAAEYESLTYFYTSPGCFGELLTAYLVRGLTSVETGSVRQDEEAEIEMEWRALSDVVTAIWEGALASPTLVVGVLAVQSLLKGQVSPLSKARPVRALGGQRLLGLDPRGTNFGTPGLRPQTKYGRALQTCVATMREDCDRDPKPIKTSRVLRTVLLRREGTTVVKPDADVSTRDNILRLIIERGSITSAELASMLVLTSAVVRRHLTQLETDGQIAEYMGATSRPVRRGRPSRRHIATSLGQVTFGDSYADVTDQVPSFLKDSLGDEGVNALASQGIGELEARCTGIVDEVGPDLEAQVVALASAFT